MASSQLAAQPRRFAQVINPLLNLFDGGQGEFASPFLKEREREREVKTLAPCTVVVAPTATAPLPADGTETLPPADVTAPAVAADPTKINYSDTTAVGHVDPDLMLPGLRPHLSDFDSC
jgi:hypothetical protein